MTAPTLTLPIRTERLVLRPFEAGDAPQWFATRSRRDVHRYLYSEPEDLAAAERSVRQRAGQVSLAEEGDTLSLVVVRADEPDVLVGDVMLHREPHDGAEIGFVFHPDFHGRGYGTEAALALLRIAFDEVGLHRVFGRCDGRNSASARLMERLGMRREAHFIANEFVRGEWTDELVYAMLAHEWDAR